MKTSEKSISQWDKKWICIGPLKTDNLKPYNHCVGIYRHVVNGKTMCVGGADNYIMVELESVLAIIAEKAIVQENNFRGANNQCAFERNYNLYFSCRRY